MDNNSHPYSFRQSEHLKLRKAIAAVFMQNNVLRSGPIKLIYAIEPAEVFDYQVAFVAPKKVHHLAVDRNRYKRLMREAFRLNKQILTADERNLPARRKILPDGPPQHFWAGHPEKHTAGYRPLPRSEKPAETPPEKV